MTFSSSHIYSFVMTLGLHVFVVLLLVVQWSFSSFETPSSADDRKFVNVVLASSNPYKAREKKKVVAKQSVREKERKKLLKPGMKIPSIPVEEKKIDTQSQREESERKLRDEERKLTEQHLANLVAEEQDYRQAVTDDEKAMAYVSQIQADIISNWSRPPSARNGMETILRVFLVPTGELVKVVVEDSSGSDAFDRSALLAVEKAEPFDVPDDPTQFERRFRQFTVLFRPEDLRL